jgi:hypothetical protein
MSKRGKYASVISTLRFWVMNLFGQPKLLNVRVIRMLSGNFMIISSAIRTARTRELSARIT